MTDTNLTTAVIDMHNRNKQTRDHYVMVMRSVQSYIPDMHRIYDLKVSLQSAVHVGTFQASLLDPHEPLKSRPN